MKNEKDWTGNKRTVFSILGASNHSETDRQTEDFYATDCRAIDALKSKVDLPHFILEPACGRGDLSERLKAMGHEVWSYDVVDRGYGEVQNFFELLTLPDSLSLSLCKMGIPRDWRWSRTRPTSTPWSSLFTLWSCAVREIWSACSSRLRSLKASVGTRSCSVSNRRGSCCNSSSASSVPRTVILKKRKG